MSLSQKILFSSYLRIKHKFRLRNPKQHRALDNLPKPYPKVIWIFWAQGYASAPELVRTCIDSWARMNSNYEIRLLAAEDIVKWLPNFNYSPQTMGFAAFSDVLRIKLLAAHGGIWVDATCYCSKPLDGWLPLMMLSDMFWFCRPSKDRIMASWFLVATKGSRMAQTLRSATRIYWSGRSQAHTYFWFHYLIELLVLSRGSFRNGWRKMPRIHADIGHLTLYLAEGHSALDGQVLSDMKGVAPLHKLTWRGEIWVDALGIATID